MNKEEYKQIKKWNIILSAIAIAIITIVGTILLIIENQNNSVIMKPEIDISYVGEKDEILININTAPIEELVYLEGIGKDKARNIIEYREENPFKTTDEIKNVNGIGDKLYENIKDNICVE
ncbi:MAG: helix-hairpin-helix domain-containing protein [Clostridia bacterium]|nr:helix-hairpin-helix domain-containing protein [Clostridia bacterium]